MAFWTVEQLGSLFIPFHANEDMQAINRFFHEAQATNPEAVRLKDDWIRWWNNLGDWEKNLGTATYDEARNRRNAFMLANAEKEDKEFVETIIRDSESTEEMQGETSRADSTGFIGERPPLIPTQYKAVAVTGLVAAGIYGIVKLVSKFTPLRFLG